MTTQMGVASNAIRSNSDIAGEKKSFLSNSLLSRIKPTESPQPIVEKKSAFKYIRESITLGIAWSKIAINNILPFKVFNLHHHHYDNPFKTTEFNQLASTSDAMTKTLDFLRAVKQSNHEALPDLQRQLIHEITKGKGSDTALHFLNYLIQQSHDAKSLTLLQSHFPKEYHHVIQQLITNLQRSNIYGALCQFSQHLSTKQQREMISKLDEFPCKQLNVMQRIGSIALQEVSRHPEANQILSRFIDTSDQALHENQMQKIQVASSEPRNIINNLKTITEISAEALDVYKRASQTPNPQKAMALRADIIGKLHNAMTSNPDFLPSIHYVVDAVVQRGKQLRDGIEGEDTRLLKLMQDLAPQFSENMIKQAVDDFCQNYAGPFELFQSMTNRISMQDEKSALFSLLHSDSTLTRSAMHLILNGVKSLATGQIVDNIYRDPAHLAESLDIKAGCDFIKDIIQQSDSTDDLKKVISNPKHIPFIRNLLSQDNVETALDDFKEMLPEAFHDTLLDFFNQYHMQSLATVGRHLIPHLSDQEISAIIHKIPNESYAFLHTKIDNLLEHLGDPDNNLITALNRQKESAKKNMKDVFNQGMPLFKDLLTDNQDQFIQLLQKAKVHTDKKGQVSPQKLTAILFEHKKLLETTNEKDRFNQIARLLADMNIPQNLADTQGLIANPKGTDDIRHNLSALRSSIAQAHIHDEIHHLTQTLLPAGQQDTPEAIGRDLRKQLAAEFLNAISTGMEPRPVENAETLRKENTDMLWGLTLDLIKATERTITLEDTQGLPIKNAAGQPSQLIFMENGSCVDEEGQILAKGDAKNLQLREQYQIEPQMQEALKPVREELKKVIEQRLPQLIKMLSDHPTDSDFKGMLEKALLPKDVQSLLVNLLDQLVPVPFRQSPIGQLATRGLENLNPALVKTIINKVPDELMDRLTHQVTRLIDDMDPYEQMAFFKDFANKLVVSLGDNQSVQSVAGVLTKGYYKAICLADKRTIAKAVLGLGCPETSAKGEVSMNSMKALVGEMTQAGGPAFQKAMQLFKGDIQIKSIREALDSMNSQVKPMPLDEVKAVIEQDLLRITNPGQTTPKFKLVDPNQYRQLDASWPSQADIKKGQLRKLGSATIAQAHEAYLWPCKNGIPQTQEQPVRVALKVQRPMIAHRILREMQALRSIQDISDSAASTLKELENSIVAETSFAREYQFGHLMKQLYKGSEDKVSVIDMLGQGNRVLIQSFSPGQSIDKLWHKKSAHFNMYFTSNKVHEDSNKKEPYKMMVELNQHQVTGLTLVTPEGQQSLKLDPLSPLTRELQELHHVYGDQLSFAQSQATYNKIATAFNLQPLAKAVSLDKQAAFLETAGQRLRTLIGHFAHAAFGGIEDQAYQIETNIQLEQSKSERARKVFIQYMGNREDGKCWTLDVFDHNGDLLKHWPPAQMSPQDHELNQTLINTLHPDSSDHSGNQLKNRMIMMSQKKTGELNNLLREMLQESMLFKGESFIDSDRHDGNLLYMEKKDQPDELVCIDTGAGTIVTEYERHGMIQMAAGIASGNADVVMSGLQQLIPGLSEKPPEKLKAMTQDLYNSVSGQFIPQEKTQEIYQFLLTKGVIDIPLGETQGQIPADEYFEELLTHPQHQALRAKALAFNTAQDAENAVEAILQYVNYKKSAQGLPKVNLSQQEAREFTHYLSNLDYGRVFATKGTFDPNPKNWVTDGHNSLLFIKSIRKIANVLESHNIYAPESIIQLNRGTKFIEDQLKNINIYKAELKQKIEEVDATQKTKTMNNAIKKNLAKTNLGEAYVSGMLSTRLMWDAVNALGWKIIPAMGSWTKQTASNLYYGQS